MVVMLFLVMSLGHPAEAESVSAPAASNGPNFPNCRLGVGGTFSPTYAITSLNLGWYMDWNARLNPAHPNGAEYVQMVRTKPNGLSVYTFTPSLITLYQIADQNPGAIWLIGNEPDSPYQDKLLPAAYAQAYHDLHQWLKQRDPSARLGVGSIVQPTPLRRQYLDQVLSAYQQLYGESLPTDLWSIHSYILRELDPSDPEAQPQGPLEVWGAYIPPGFLPGITRGLLYTYSDMFNAAIFRQRLIDFRTWMRDRGYQETPLYITEYGTLFPYPPFINFDPYEDEFGVPIVETRTAMFMTKTFDLLRTYTDTTMGYPADNGRLVQRWLWYSFDDKIYGGLLFNPFSGQRTGLGNVFASYAQAISPTVDLLAVRAQGDLAVLRGGATLLTDTLRAQFSNIGNIATAGALTVTFYRGPLGQSSFLIGSPHVITRALSGCAASIVVSTTWTGLSSGSHVFHVQIETSAPEVNLSNNQIEGRILVANHQLWLPLILRTPQ